MKGEERARDLSAWAAVCAAVGLGAGLVFSAGCGFSGGPGGPGGDTGPIAHRAGVVVVDGCTLDAGQRATLASAATKKVLSDVVLLCLSAQDGGQVALRGGTSKDMLTAAIGEVRAAGYRVRLGLTAMDAQDNPLDPAHASAVLVQTDALVTTVAALAGLADGIEVAPPPLQDAARDSVTALVTGLAAAVRPQGHLGVFVPPSVSRPSDIPGGEAFDVPALAQQVDRVRLMTLDFSSDHPPGPTIDAAWALDAAHLALSRTGGAGLDVSVPLYGTDFGPNTQDSVDYDQAVALAAANHVTPVRGPGEALHFAYRDQGGARHDVWYDDALSTLSTLRAFSPSALPPAVGVLYYGLGAEDPTLFPTLADAQSP